MNEEDDPRKNEEPRTVFSPGRMPTWRPGQPAAPVPPPGPPPSARDTGRIRVGDVLNNMFEVRRFIGRGGMGEVFEGLSISDEDRVAIKVVLPALAADPDVTALFRREARTLKQLNHPALVRYRALAQEPVLNVLYIVTEFIDGPSLADALPTLRPSPAELTALARRLADGLRAAHGLGAIHRDISPDNILLKDGRLDQAVIIDFGIAKDLDPSSSTIIGSGFAGKLGYVAPEQLGAFERRVGPWTDIYSLGLLLLAVARGRDADMGGSFVEAIDKRRGPPDLTAVPAELGPVIARMLEPDPADRFRSMTEVLAALERTADRRAAHEAEAPAGLPPAPSSGGASARTPLLVGAAAAAALLLALLIWLSSGDDPPRTPGGTEASEATAETGVVPVVARTETARSAINAVLPSIDCTWLDITDIRQSGDGVGVALTGVADAPGRAQGAISRALAARGIVAKDIDFEEVATIPAGACTALDAFRAIRKPDADGLSVTQRKWEMVGREDGAPVAKIALNVDLGPPTQGLAFFGLKETGAVERVDVNDAGDAITSRAAMAALLTDNSDVTRLGPNRYRLQLDIDHLGWSGFLMLTGREPFDPDLITIKAGEASEAWKRRFAAAAAAGGWKSEMVWFRTVDEAPNDEG